MAWRRTTLTVRVAPPDAVHTAPALCQFLDVGWSIDGIVHGRTGRTYTCYVVNLQRRTCTDDAAPAAYRLAVPGRC